MWTSGYSSEHWTWNQEVVGYVPLCLRQIAAVILLLKQTSVGIPGWKVLWSWVEPLIWVTPATRGWTLSVTKVRWHVSFYTAKRERQCYSKQWHKCIYFYFPSVVTLNQFYCESLSSYIFQWEDEMRRTTSKLRTIFPGKSTWPEATLNTKTDLEKTWNATFSPPNWPFNPN